jgi:putative protein-disulfide isomerase
MKLVYVGDPMCSWCYGFGKELTQLRATHPALELEIVVGGLRAGGTEILDDAAKQFRLQHWARVEAASGLPFNREAFVARQGFVYDTEPVCRAVVAARRLAPQSDLLAVFRAFQHAFYAEGRDTTDGKQLADIGAAELQRQGHDISAAGFLYTWREAATIAETHADFARTRKLGVSSFPSLLLDTGDGVRDVSPGYANAEQLDQLLSEALAAA